MEQVKTGSNGSNGNNSSNEEVRNMSKQVDKCWRGFKHLWSQEPVKVTRDHKVLECERCHGKKWVERRV